MTSLLVGFDSAWTATKSGAIVGAVFDDNQGLIELDGPRSVSFVQAEATVQGWRREYGPRHTFLFLDQPTVVPNSNGQRPVENIIASPIGVRRGAVQPANRSRVDMFGVGAPVWRFLASLGCAVDPLAENSEIIVAETYPVLSMIALGWVLPDEERGTRLPKYNPGRPGTFALSDWQFVCRRAAELAKQQGLARIASWLDDASQKAKPTKSMQDDLDACICLLVAQKFAAGETLLLIGQRLNGYVIVPESQLLRDELTARCLATGRVPHEWLASYSRSAG